MAKTAYGLSPKLSRQVSEGESFLRDDLAATPVVQARPMSPARPVVPYGQAYAANGQPDGRVVMGNGFLGAYPMINTKNPTLVVLPPYVDSFSRIQDRLARFYTMFAPMFAQMAQQARANAGKVVRGMGVGGKAKAQPKADNFEDKGSWNAYVPGVDMRGDRDSFALRQPGVRPDYKVGVKPTDRSWWPNPQSDSFVVKDRIQMAPTPPAASPESTTPTGESVANAPAQTGGWPVTPYNAYLRPETVHGGLDFEGAYRPKERYAYEDWKDTLKGVISNPGSPIDDAVRSFFNEVSKFFRTN